MSTLWAGVLTLRRIRPLYISLTLVGSVHFVEWGLDPSWGSSTLWTYLSFLPSSCPSTLWTMVLTLRGVRPPCGLKFNFLTLVGFIHVVDLSLDPSWGPSTLWTYISFLPLSGPSTLCTGVLTLGGVRPLCRLFSVGVRTLIVVIF